MSSYEANIEIPLYDQYKFTNASAYDIVFYSAAETQKIHIGTKSNANSGIAVSDSNIVFAIQGNSNVGNAYTFCTGNSNAAMTIMGNGFVGVGVSNPSYVLDVGGTVNASQLLINGVPLSSSSGGGFTAISGNVSYSTCNIGIGKSNPVYALDVEGTVNATQLLINGSALSTSTGGGFNAVSNNCTYTTCNVGIGVGKSNPSYPLDVNGIINASSLYVNGAPYIGSQWVTNSNNTAISITSSNVGIGTSTPQVGLHIASDMRIDSNLYMAKSIAIQGLTIRKNTGAMANVTNVVSTIPGYTYNSNVNIGAASNHSITYQVGSTEYMRVNSNGMVGVGTTTPAYKLDVNGSANATTVLEAGVALTSKYALSNVLSNFMPTSGGTIAGMLTVSSNISYGNTGGDYYITTPGQGHIWANTGGSSSYANMNYSVGSNGSAGDHVFSVGGDKTTSSGTEVMRITSTTNVGIGTSNPAYKLDVNGTAKMANYTFNGNWISSISNVNIGASSNHSITYQIGSTELMRLSSNGMVGVGTSTPAYKLDVSGSANASTILEGGVALTSKYALSNVMSNFMPASGGTMTGTLNVSSNISYGSSGGDYFITTAGQGHIWANIGGSSSYTNMNYSVGSNGSAGDHVFSVGGDKNTSGGTEVMRLKSTGMVGVGTTAPSYKLDVNGSANATTVLEGGVAIASKYALSNVLSNFIPASGGTITGSLNTVGLNVSSNISFGSNGGDYYITTAGQGHIWANTGGSSTYSNMNYSVGSNGSAGDHIFSVGGDKNTSGGTEVMRITSTGNVGIGTSTPAYKLDVSGITKIANYTFAGNQVSSLCNVTINCASNYSFYLRAAGVDLMFINGTTGRVGVGMVTPNYMLDVLGTFNATTLYQNGVALHSSVTVDTTNASNITSGTLNSNRLPTSGVTAGSYGSNNLIPRLTVDATGRITAVSTLSMSVAASNVSGLAPSATINTTNASNITTGILPLSVLPTSSVTNSSIILGNASTYFTLTIDQYGRITGATSNNAISLSASSISSGTLAVAQGGTGATSTTGTGANVLANSPTLSGTVVATTVNATTLQQGGSAISSLFAASNHDAAAVTTGTFALARFQTSGVTASTYGSASSIPSVTVDQYGRVTSATSSNVSISTTNITSGTLAVARGGTGTTSSTGSGSVVLSTSPSISSMSVGSNIYMNNCPLYLKNSDSNHSLVYNQAVDGPRLCGWGGGYLGSTNGTNAIQWNSNGYIGIGTSPSYPLHVTTTAVSSGTGTTYYALYAAGGQGVAIVGNTTNVAFSIVTNGNVWANGAGFYVSSDERIKTNIVDISHKDALTIIDTLQPKHFKYIDVASGTDTQYGFIAQEVREVLPTAVTESTGFVPSIYTKTAVSGSNTLVFVGEHDLQEGDKVKLYAPNEEKEVIVNVLSVDDHEVVVDKTISSEDVFVYGKEVDDFLTLDDSTIVAVAVAGIKALKKENDNLRAEIGAIKEYLGIC
jgi:hypothetical protein